MKIHGATLTLAVVGALAAAQVARERGLFMPFPAFAMLGSAAKGGRRSKVHVAPKGKFIVILSAEPNPDYAGVDFRGHTRISPWYEVVDDLRGASAAVKSFRDRTGIGGGNWSGGQVFDDKGEQVAQVSYNGRVWEPGKWPTKQIVLYGSAARRGALTAQERQALPDRDFAVIEVRGGMKVRKYPISDRRHGQIALTYVMSPSNARHRAQVKRAVFARYPDLRAWWDSQTAERQHNLRRAA